MQKMSLERPKGAVGSHRSSWRRLCLTICLHNKLGQLGMSSNANSSTNVQKEQTGHAEGLEGSMEVEKWKKTLGMDSASQGSPVYPSN